MDPAGRSPETGPDEHGEDYGRPRMRTIARMEDSAGDFRLVLVGRGLARIRGLDALDAEPVQPRPVPLEQLQDHPLLALLAAEEVVQHERLRHGAAGLGEGLAG